MKRNGVSISTVVAAAALIAVALILVFRLNPGVGDLRRPERSLAKEQEGGSLPVESDIGAGPIGSGPRHPSLGHGENTFESQSDQVKASLVLGLGSDFEGHGSVAGYFLHLEQLAAGGDDRALMELVSLYGRCGRANSDKSVLQDPEHPGYLVAYGCSTLPDRGPGFEREMIATAAGRGVPSAVLREFSYPPLDLSETEGGREIWARGVEDRLRTLAQSGHNLAHFELGRLYMSPEFGTYDPSQAIISFHRYILGADPNSPQALGAEQIIARLCGANGLSSEAKTHCL